MKNRRLFDWLSLAASAGILTATGLAAPVITATKDDNLAPGLRKLPGNTITCTITFGNGGATDASSVLCTVPDPVNTISVSVNSTPIARNDSCNTIGNVQISVTAPALLADDYDPNSVGPALTVTAVNTAGTQGSMALNANGSFSLNPALGHNGATTFTCAMSADEGNNLFSIPLQRSRRSYFQAPQTNSPTP